MESQPDQLTPRQKCWFITTLLFICLAFSSVFVYASWRGQQVRAAREQALLLQNRNVRLTHIHEADVTRPLAKPRNAGHVTQIARGTSGIPTCLSRQGTRADWRWIIHQKRTGNVYAKDSSPANFLVSPTRGALYVPASIPVGRYTLSVRTPSPKHGATYTCTTYEFEVIENDGIGDTIDGQVEGFDD